MIKKNRRSQIDEGRRKGSNGPLLQRRNNPLYGENFECLLKAAIFSSELVEMRPVCIFNDFLQTIKPYNF